MNERKNVFMAMMMVAVGLFIVPIFVKVPYIQYVRYIGFVVMALATIYLIAGDKLKFGKKESQENLIKRKQQEYDAKSKILELEIELQKRQNTLNTLKTEQKQNKEKIPDVLGNIMPFISSNKKKDEDDLRKLF